MLATLPIKISRLYFHSPQAENEVVNITHAVGLINRIDMITIICSKWKCGNVYKILVPKCRIAV